MSDQPIARNKRPRPRWRPSGGLAPTLEAMLDQCTPADATRAAHLSAALEVLEAGRVAVLLAVPPLRPIV